MNRTEPYAIIQSSPKVLEAINPVLHGTGNSDETYVGTLFPFRSLRIGHSFAVPFEDMKPGTLQTLRSLAISHAKKTKRKFKVIVHRDLNRVEVARIA